MDDLFKVGQNIMYATQGAGIITGIEEREFSGEIHRYYVIGMVVNRMQLLIPVDKMVDAPIRSITNIKALRSILDAFTHGQSDPITSWKERYNTNTNKIKTGDLKACVEVVRDLTRMKAKKKLNASEKDMLAQAQKIMMSEINLIEGITPEQLESFY
ncbi:CarD family transcriptional regulator [Kurthia huakuii]|uniref:CarD family transcriptional regulator n=1 Tax=Kurthia huakuii TaxID=1421019 RepID=UPI0038996176